jgi:putative transposase
MLHPNEEGCKNISLKNQPSHLQLLSKAIGKTLSSYTQAINLQNDRIGNLFQKKTKSKCLTETSFHLSGYTSQDYLLNCFWYIHNNPAEAGIVEKLQDWPYSSFPDYYGFRNGMLCAKEKAMERIGISKTDLNPLTERNIDKKVIEGIW